MTRSEFHAKFDGPHLLFLIEVWGIRKEPSSAMGSLVDLQSARLRNLLDEMYSALCPPAPLPTNGVHRNGQANGKKLPPPPPLSEEVAIEIPSDCY